MASVRTLSNYNARVDRDFSFGKGVTLAVQLEVAECDQPSERRRDRVSVRFHRTKLHHRVAHNRSPWHQAFLLIGNEYEYFKKTHIELFWIPVRLYPGL